MNIDDITLLAYVEGGLSAHDSAQVEAAVAASPQLAQRLAVMRASALPFFDAFARQVLPPVPGGLLGRIFDLSRTGRAGSTEVRPPSHWPRVAAAFLAGALVSGGVVDAWFATVPRRSPAESVSWVGAVIDYQALYRRETLATVTEDPESSGSIIAAARRDDGIDVSIPDLRDSGLTFKRVQRLSFHDQKIVQMAYLPETGGPIALCATHDLRPDEQPHAHRIADLDAVEWRRNGIGYVLVGRDPSVDLDELGRRIANGAATPLSGRDRGKGRSDRGTGTGLSG